jgi:hypothetical protein
MGGVSTGKSLSLAFRRSLRTAGPGSETCAILMPDNPTTQTPLFLEMPPFARPNSAACALGQYRNFETAFKTLILVLLDTLPAPLTTRDTVACETPESLATSLTVHGRTFRAVGTPAGISQLPGSAKCNSPILLPLVNQRPPVFLNFRTSNQLSCSMLLSR